MLDILIPLTFLVLVVLHFYVQYEARKLIEELRKQCEYLRKQHECLLKDYIAARQDVLKLRKELDESETKVSLMQVEADLAAKRLRQPELPGVQEGAVCNRDGCTGRMKVWRDGECTCFQSSPCGSCANLGLECTECGFIVEHEYCEA
jgi:hypothetical protein